MHYILLIAYFFLHASEIQPRSSTSLVNQVRGCSKDSENYILNLHVTALHTIPHCPNHFKD